MNATDQATENPNSSRSANGGGGFFKRIAFSTLKVAALVYVAMLVGLAVFENNLVYPGSPYARGNWDAQGQGFTEVEFQAEDETKLFGWYADAPMPDRALVNSDAAGEENELKRRRAILYCHGNAENVAQASAYAGKRFRQELDASIFVFDYRGFGKSEGSPHEAGLQMDADAALAWLCEKTSLKPADIIIVGHSIGGGPACYLANKYGCQMLVLQRTFSSLPDAAAYKYPMFPIHFVMRNRMNSAEAIRACQMPLFQSHGSADQLVPIELGKQVFENSPAGQKEFFKVDGMTHWDPLPEEYWVKLRAFADANAD